MAIPLSNLEAEVEEIITITNLVTLEDEMLVFMRLKSDKLTLYESLFIVARN